MEQNTDNPKAPLLAVSKTARERGVEAGMPAFLAKRRLRGLQIKMRDDRAEAALRERLSTLLETYTPDFSVQIDGKAIANMTGTPCMRKESVAQWAPKLWASVLNLGLDAVAVGMGSSQILARVYAKLADPGGVKWCPQGMEKVSLDSLPPSLLPDLSPQALGRFRKYGLIRIEQIAKLDRRELALRFGAEADKLYCLARGLDYEGISSKTALLFVETSLTQDCHDVEALRFKVRIIADKLAHALNHRQWATRRLTLILQYSDSRRLRKEIRWHAPTAMPPMIAKRADALFLELHQRRVDIHSIRLEAAAPEEQTGQVDIFFARHDVRDG